MKIPYNQVHANGGIIFAARSGQIQTFSAQDGKLISTWKHPDVEKVAEAVKNNAEAEKEPQEEDQEEAQDEDQPPAKRQKTTGAEDVSASKPTEGEPVQEDAASAKGGRNKRKKGKSAHQHAKSGRTVSKVPDRPIVTHLTSTADGKHLLAVTGHDKTIWVFEHDGAGHLSNLSHRAMPKRPSAVAIGPDSQILCADKFGDVYSLPLIPDGTPIAPTLRPAPKPLTQPAANELTVHSKRNLVALKAQQKQLEKARLEKGDAESKPDVPDFELTLQLGHVSMLTALVLGEREGRRYIITGDRDEHIRVSRYMPQAHIIERFCMGHRDFVGALVIPPTRGDVLISGGGDTDLFLWNWLSGSLLSKTGVLSLAQEISPETSKVAVSNLYSLAYPAEAGNLTYILAICEDIKAIFSWQLTDNNALNHPGVIQLPGNPLALSIISEDGSAPKILAAIDPGSETPAKNLNIFSLTTSDGRLAVDTTSHVEEDAIETGDLEVTESEVRSLLYGMEHLRKQKGGEDEGEGDGEGDVETTETEASGQ
ncbi:tRNA (guanine-N(7)-)-methyltransferase non-catalytic subunit trm82 [Amphichorda felina]